MIPADCRQVKRMINTRKYYTLIELLIVVGLMGLLMGLAIPSFSRLIKGSGKVVATRELTAKINAARSYAVSKRETVAIVFPATGDSSSIPASYKNTSYRVCTVYNSGGTWKFGSWIDGETWNHLPTGMVFRAVGGIADGELTTAKSGDATVAENEIIDCNIKDMLESAVDTIVPIKYSIIIKPSGSLSCSGSDPVRILIAEGVSSPSDGTITYTSKTGEKPVSVMTISKYTCRITYSDVLGN